VLLEQRRYAELPATNAETDAKDAHERNEQHQLMAVDFDAQLREKQAKTAHQPKEDESLAAANMAENQSLN
jgi:hypothetical protein